MWLIRLVGSRGDGDWLCVGSCVGSGGTMCMCWGDVEVSEFALCFVDWMLARFAFMCPLIVATWFGGQRRSCLVVIVGKVVRNPALMALAKVSRVGENRDLCWNSILSAMVGTSIIELREWHLLSSRWSRVCWACEFLGV